ncbi:uncharacterized protein [Argopecten irradians]|uniref:uncharacterized protein isoform X2 n=1 Tax=Argopecten irradians TaxID=31199 RepID=UPI0037228B42
MIWNSTTLKFFPLLRIKEEKRQTDESVLYLVVIKVSVGIGVTAEMIDEKLKNAIGKLDTSSVFFAATIDVQEAFKAGYGDICYQQTDDTLKYQVFRECFYGYEQAVELQGVLSIYNTIPSVAVLLANISAENCRLLSIGWSCFNTSLHAVSNGNQCSKDSASETISYYATAIGINEMDLNAALHHCAELYDSGETGISENGDRFATWILAECLPSLDWTDPGLLNAILYGQAVEDNACRIGHHIFECGQHIARNNKFAPYFHFNIEDVMKTLVQKAAWFDSIMPGISLCFIQDMYVPDLNCSNIDSVILNLNNTCPSVNYLNTTDSTLYCSHLRATLLCAKVAFNWSPFPPEAFNDIVMFNTIKGNEAIFRGVFGGNSVSSCNVLDGDGEMIYWHLNGSVIPDKNFIQPGNCTSDNIEYLGEYICHESTPIYHGPLLPDDACGAVLAKKECIDRNMYSWAGKVCDNVWDVFGNRVEEMLGKNTSLDYCSKSFEITFSVMVPPNADIQTILRSGVGALLYDLEFNDFEVLSITENKRRKRQTDESVLYLVVIKVSVGIGVTAEMIDEKLKNAIGKLDTSSVFFAATIDVQEAFKAGYGDICYQQTDDTLKYQVFRECFYGYEQAVELQGVLSIYNTIPSVAALLANIRAENCRLLSIGWSCFNTSLHAVSNGNQCSKDSASETISYYATAIGINEMDLNAALHHCAELYDSGETGISENGDRFATWILAECLPSLDWTDPGLLNAILYGQAVEDNACRIGHHIFECGQHIARNNKFAPYFHFNIEDVMKTLVQKAAWFDSIMPGISLCFIQDLNCSNIDSVILNLNNTCPSVNYLNTTDSTLYCSHLRATLLCAKVAFNWSPFPPEAFNDIVMFNTIKGNEAIFRGVFGGNSVSSCNVLDGDGEMIYWHLNGSVIPDKNFIQPGNCTSDNIEYLGEYICHESTPIYHGPLLPDDACGAVLAKKECIDRNMYSWAGKVCDNVWDVFGNRVEEMLGKNTSLDYCSKSFEITFSVMVPPNADIQTILRSGVGALLYDLEFNDFEVLSITENKRRKRQTDESVLYLVVIKVSVGIGVTAEMIDEKLKNAIGKLDTSSVFFAATIDVQEAFKAGYGDICYQQTDDTLKYQVFSGMFLWIRTSSRIARCIEYLQHYSQCSCFVGEHQC